MEIIALEYQPASSRNGYTACLHNNYYDERTGDFCSKLCTNGYHPLALIQEQYINSPEIDGLCDWLLLEQPSVADAIRRTYNVLAKLARHE